MANIKNLERLIEEMRSEIKEINKQIESMEDDIFRLWHRGDD